MGEYLLSNEAIILRNLMLHPPVEGSIASHEAWKQNVSLLLKDSDKKWPELYSKGFISVSFRNQCISYGKSLPIEKQG